MIFFQSHLTQNDWVDVSFLLAKFRKQILKVHKIIAKRKFTCPILGVVWPHREHVLLSFRFYDGLFNYAKNRSLDQELLVSPFFSIPGC